MFSNRQIVAYTDQSIAYYTLLPESNNIGTSNSIPAGTIAGIVIGGLLAILLATLGICLFVRKRRKVRVHADDGVYHDRFEARLSDGEAGVRYLQTPEIQYKTDSKPGHFSTESEQTWLGEATPTKEVCPVNRVDSSTRFDTPSTIGSVPERPELHKYHPHQQPNAQAVPTSFNNLFIVPPNIHEFEASGPTISSPSSPTGGLGVGELISSDQGAQTAVFARPRLVENRLSSQQARQHQQQQTRLSQNIVHPASTYNVPTGTASSSGSIHSNQDRISKLVDDQDAIQRRLQRLREIEELEERHRQIQDEISHLEG
jgi:hypothetical protein